MDTVLFALMTLATRWLQPRHNAQVQFFQAQIRILRARIPSERLILSPVERAELLRLGEPFATSNGPASPPTSVPRTESVSSGKAL